MRLRGIVMDLLGRPPMILGMVRMQIPCFPNASGSPPDSRSGFSLLEILIALVVVGIGTSAFLRTRGGLENVMGGSSKMMRAGQLIEKQVESMRIEIARETLKNWPPPDNCFMEAGFKLSRMVSPAFSLKNHAYLREGSA